jgi:hypothetical protein
LNTRAASCQLYLTPAACWRSCRLRYLLGRPTSCRSVRLRPRPRVSCPCWAQCSSRRELCRGGGKKYPALAPPNVAFALRSNSRKASGPRGAIGRGRFAVAGGGRVREGVRVGAVNWCTLKVPRSGQVQGCRECGLLLPPCLRCLTRPSLAPVVSAPRFGYRRRILQSLRPNSLRSLVPLLRLYKHSLHNGRFNTQITMPRVQFHFSKSPTGTNTTLTNSCHNYRLPAIVTPPRTTQARATRDTI